MELDEIKKIASQAKGTLDNLLKVNAELINKIPAEYGDLKKDLATDIGRISTLVDKKDVTTLTDLLCKYADNNTK